MLGKVATTPKARHPPQLRHAFGKVFCPAGPRHKAERLYLFTSSGPRSRRGPVAHRGSRRICASPASAAAAGPGYYLTSCAAAASSSSCCSGYFPTWSVVVPRDESSRDRSATLEALPRGLLSSGVSAGIASARRRERERRALAGPRESSDHQALGRQLPQQQSGCPARSELTPADGAGARVRILAPGLLLSVASERPPEPARIVKAIVSAGRRWRSHPWRNDDQLSGPSQRQICAHRTKTGDPRAPAGPTPCSQGPDPRQGSEWTREPHFPNPSEPSR